jgi:threonine aldolase
VLAEAVTGQKAAEIDMSTVQTNIVIFKLTKGGDAAAFVAAMKERGVLTSAIGPRSVRFVTHFDVSREECEGAAKAAAEVLCNWN